MEFWDDGNGFEIVEKKFDLSIYGNGLGPDIMRYGGITC